MNKQQIMKELVRLNLTTHQKIVVSLLLENAIKDFVTERGRKGGMVTAKRGKEHYQDMQKKSMEAKRKKIDESGRTYFELPKNFGKMSDGEDF